MKTWRMEAVEGSVVLRRNPGLWFYGWVAQERTGGGREEIYRNRGMVAAEHEICEYIDF